MPLSLLSSPRSAAHGQAERPRSRLLQNPAVFLFVILTAQLMVVLDTTIVNVALPHIQRGLGFSASSLSWVINAYILTFGGLLLLGARAGDLVGRRRTFLVGIAVFSLSSLAGGFAPDGALLLAARAAQGIGAALAAPSALSLLTTVFREGPARVRAIALYTTVSAAGAATGLVAGGLLTQLVSWRWVMFVNVPIGVTVWLLGRVVVAETERRHGRFDVLGALTSTAGMTGIVFGLVEAGSKGWTQPVTLISFVLGLALLGLFVHTEANAEEPILPLRLFASPTRTTANAARGLLYAGFYGMFFFLSQFFQDVQGYSPLRAGVAFLPIPVSVFIGSQLTSRVLMRRLPERVLMMMGAGIATVSLLWATRLNPGTSYGQIVPWLVLVGLGSGISFVSLTSASLHEVDPADAGAASGLINVSQQLGAAVGLAVLVTFFGVVTHHGQLSAHVAPAALARLHASVVHGLDDVFALGALFTVSALVAVAAFMGRTRRSDDAEIAELDLSDVEPVLIECAAEAG
ncbi:MAG TPA: MFS transporter [Acidimicrobiales bacterium]|nr:MFS transporter [Acidimicrobiales bacterium]